MNNISAKVIKVGLGILLFILLLLFTVPVLFKEKIKTIVESSMNKSLDARVTFQDYNLGFFRNFPNLSFSLKKVSVAGNGRFEGDTLAAFKSLDLVFNLLSLFFKSGYEVKSIIIDQAVVNAIVLKDGKANWDIARSSSSSAQINNNTSSAVTSPGQTSSPGSSVKILLRNLEIKNSSVSYSDSTMSLDTKVENLNFKLAGRMTLRETFVKMILSSGETTVIMGGIKYLNKVKIDSKIDMLADLDSMKFTMRENYFSINELKIFLTGFVAKAGKNIKTDLHFGTDKSSFKTLMSLVPSVYMSGYEDLKASGEVSLSGSAKGIYSDADSSIPDVDLKFAVSNGLISYPALPEKISNINISANVFLDGKVFDKTTLNLEKFHFELAGNPFDMEFFMTTPVSDPDFKGSMNGKIDLNALSKALPMKGIRLSGLMDISLSLAGKLSMIEKEQYESFSARGTLGIRDMVYSITGYPRVEIKSASLVFSPASTLIKSSDILVQGTSDFSVTGSLENYIPYLLKNKTLRANLMVHSNLTDVSEIMKGMTSDTVISASASAVRTPASDTAGLVIIPVPGNVAIDLNARITKLSYDKIRAENVTGHVIAKDRILSLRETNMNFMGGTILLNADYDTRDTLKPVMKADINIKDIGVKDAFNTFNTVQKLAPAAKGIDGKINAKFAYVCLLGKDMMPVVNSINGEGKLQSDEITLLESKTFDQMKTVLKLGDSYSNTFKDINISFKISDGRIFVSPFDVKTGNLKMNISGDQGIDQTLNYIIKTEIPRSALGSSVNSLIDNLSSQTAKFGFAFKPSEVLKVNVKVTGTFSKPVVSPLF